MKNPNKTSLTLAAATIIGLSFLSSNADAQGWRSSGWGWGQSSHGSSCSQSRSSLRSDVYAVDRLANQMAPQFSREMNCRCRDSVALLNHLKKHASLTRNLVAAYNGNCITSFKKAACAVNDSMACVSKQSRRVRELSCSLRGSISESAILAKQIHRNSSQFSPRNSYTSHRRPAPQAPVYGRPPVRNNDRHSHSDPFASLLSSLFNR